MGGNIKNSTVMTYLDSLAPEPEPPTRQGYDFAGWYLQPEYVDTFNFATDTVKKNFTIYADWSINSYKVSFNSNGGNYTPDTVVAVYNTRIEAPVEPTKDGFVFDGWYSDEALTQVWIFEVSKVTKDVTLYAKWVDPVSVEDSQDAGIRVYPNPVSTSLQLSDLPAGASVEIISSDGKMMIRRENTGVEETISVADLPTGIYTLVVTSGDETFSFRVVKQ